MSAAEAEAPSSGASRGRAIFAWCLYDWAMSSFNTVIGTFVFSLYFARGIVGDETSGSAIWAQMIGISGILVAVLAPIVGAVADHGGRRKPWLGALTLIAVLATAALWSSTPEPGSIARTLVLVAIASIAFELANVVYNAMLPTVAPEGMEGRVSGWGWGLGYIGGLGSLALTLFLLVGFPGMPPILALDVGAAENLRASALLVAVWYAAFAVPLFLYAPDAMTERAGIHQAVRKGIGSLVATLRQVRRYKCIVRYLIASALWRDGLATLFALGGLYAAGTYGMGLSEILIFAIGLNVTAGIGAAGFAFVDDRIGSKPTILISLTGLVATGIPILLMSDPAWFIASALLLGIFVGPAQAAARTMMARLSPVGMETEMFGLYALSGRAASMVGPFLFATATEYFSSQRAGMTTVILLFIVGGLLLLGVRESRAEPLERPG